MKLLMSTSDFLPSMGENFTPGFCQGKIFPLELIGEKMSPLCFQDGESFFSVIISKTTSESTKNEEYCFPLVLNFPYERGIMFLKHSKLTRLSQFMFEQIQEFSIYSEGSPQSPKFSLFFDAADSGNFFPCQKNENKKTLA